MLKDKFSFTLLKENGKARLGQISTSRGLIDTPTFMTVGTQGTIKSTFSLTIPFSKVKRSP